ncbi:ABC transporter permease subunit [Patescibacteria group bacterium]
MWNIIIQRLKEQRNSIIYYAMGLIAYAWMVMAVFPSFSGVDFTEFFEAYPEDLLKFFGGTDAMTMTTIEGFLSIEFLNFFFILIILFYIGAAAGSVIAGRIENKNMDFFLSQPISRTKIVVSETLVTLFYSIILVFATSFSILGFAQVYDIDIGFDGLMAFSIVAIFLLWAIYGIAIFLSSFLKSKISTTLGTVFIVFAMYIFYAMTEIVEKLEDYDKFSIFYLYTPQELLTEAEINWTQIGTLFLIFIIGLGLSLFIFHKRDV